MTNKKEIQILLDRKRMQDGLDQKLCTPKNKPEKYFSYKSVRGELDYGSRLSPSLSPTSNFENDNTPLYHPSFDNRRRRSTLANVPEYGFNNM